MCRDGQTWTLPDMSRLVRRAKVGARTDRHGHTPLGVSGCPIRPCPGRWRDGKYYLHYHCYHCYGYGSLRSGRIAGTRSPGIPLHLKFKCENWFLSILKNLGRKSRLQKKFLEPGLREPPDDPHPLARTRAILVNLPTCGMAPILIATPGMRTDRTHESSPAPEQPDAQPHRGHRLFGGGSFNLRSHDCGQADAPADPGHGRVLWDVRGFASAIDALRGQRLG